MSTALTTTEKLVPAYIPWETFTEFVAHLKSTAIPSRIDKSVMPDGMPSLTRGQIQSALRFLRLVDSAGSTNASLRSLVHAYETDRWEAALGEILSDSYAEIIGNIDLDNATQHQLDERFKVAGVNGQMLLKSVRFYLAALNAAGLTFSPHLNARRRRAVHARKRAISPRPAASSSPTRKNSEAPSKGSEKFKAPEGTRTYPLYFRDKPDGVLVVPTNLTAVDCKVIELQLAVLKAYADGS